MKEDLLSFHDTFPLALTNQDSFELLYGDYFTPIYKYIYYRIRDREITMDMVQNVFLKAFTNRESIRESDALKYLYTIARNQLIDHLRKKHSISFDAFENFIERTPDESIANPEENTIINNEKDFIQKILITLPEPQREVIILRYLQELEYSEIAGITGKNEATIRKTVSRALKILQERYSQLFTYENQ